MTPSPAIENVLLPARASSWIEYPRSGPAARARLFCLPYAGGTAATYRNWHGSPLDGIEVCPILLPARERRINEAPFDRIPLLVRQLADVLPDDRPLPYSATAWAR